MTMREGVLLETAGITRVFTLGKTEVRALRGVDLTVRRGEMVAIMGASGSGKSTLMNILGCLDSPTSGTYRLDGIRVDALGKSELAEADFGLSVGRHPALCERVVEDPSVSRRHLRLSLRQGRLSLEDLNSLNGTLLDGRLLAPFQAVTAEAGQAVTLGAVALRIREVSG